MVGIVLLMLILSALAWLGALRRWPPRAWPACWMIGALIALAALLGKLRALRNSPVPVILAACAAAALAGLVAWLFFARLVPKRRPMRFLYHAAFLIFAFAIAALFPFSIAWQRGVPPEASRKLSEAHRPLAGKFGLRELNVQVLDTRGLAACVTSFSGDSANVVVSSGLVDALEPEEMGFVIAHELSHHKLKHYPARMGLAGGALLVYFLAVWLVLPRKKTDDDPPSDWRRELDLFLRWTPLHLLAGLLAALGPLALCRAQETEADLHAVEVTGDAGAARAALEKLASELPDRRRNPLELLSTHPGLDKRIAHLR
ncbi:MAG: M48 family metallopeptidase [Planctomycetota bacterium]|jgi:Zn-dependent protease with chaperone function